MALGNGMIQFSDLLKDQQKKEKALKLIVKMLKPLCPEMVLSDIVEIAEKALK